MLVNSGGNNTIAPLFIATAATESMRLQLERVQWFQVGAIRGY